MLLPSLPDWVGIVVCAIILVSYILTIIKAAAAAKAVEELDDGDRIKQKTAFIRNISIEAEGLIARAKDPETKAACKKVYEALRYSDPMSTPELSVIEAKLTVKLDELRSSIDSGSKDNIIALADELVILCSDRNRKCKALK